MNQGESITAHLMTSGDPAFSGWRDDGLWSFHLETQILPPKSECFLKWLCLPWYHQSWPAYGIWLPSMRTGKAPIFWRKHPRLSRWKTTNCGTLKSRLPTDLPELPPWRPFLKSELPGRGNGKLWKLYQPNGFSGSKLGFSVSKLSWNQHVDWSPSMETVAPPLTTTCTKNGKKWKKKNTTPTPRQRHRQKCLDRQHLTIWDPHKNNHQISITNHHFRWSCYRLPSVDCDIFYSPTLLF